MKFFRRHIGLFVVLALAVIAGCGKELASGPKSEDPVREPALPHPIQSLWESDVLQYHYVTRDPRPLRAEAEVFMRNVLLTLQSRRQGPPPDKLVEQGKSLFERGCQDPLLKTYYGHAIVDSQGAFAALRTLVEALNDWRGAPYGGEQRRMGVYTLFMAKPYAKALPWDAVRKEVVDCVRRRMTDPHVSPDMRRIIYDELSALMGDNCGKNWEDTAAIESVCRQLPSADPWLVHMVAGRTYVAKAWHHRGGEWGYKVGPEAWKLFAENLQKAATEYTTALKLHPECPEAAAEMITVAMGGGSEIPVSEWFAKATAAEIDYLPAYDKMRWALRPRWGGSHDEMFAFGCKCSDSRRFDTMVPFVLLRSVCDINAELGYSDEVWQRKEVYSRLKQMLEDMAKEPTRIDGKGLYPCQSSAKSLHAILAQRAGKFDEARQLLDDVGDNPDRWILNQWSPHPQWELARIYAFGGKGGPEIVKAFHELESAPTPFTQAKLREVQSHFTKAHAADQNLQSQAYCQCWIDDLEGRLAYGEGKWFEKKLDPQLLGWAIGEGTWSQQDPRTAVGRAKWEATPIYFRPRFFPLFPLEIEFTIEVQNPPVFPMTLGLFIPTEGNVDPISVKFHQFFIRPKENLAGVEIHGRLKTVPCPLKQANRLRVQLAEGRAVLYVNDQLCVNRSEKDFRPFTAFNLGSLGRLFPDTAVKVSEVRFRKWNLPDKPASSDKIEQQEKDANKKEKLAPAEKEKNSAK